MNKEQYLLICLMEELAEATRAASKCLRFGLNNGDPNGYTSNKGDLIKEMGHVQATYSMLQHLQLSPAEIDLKVRRTEEYMNISRELGILE